jgi:hypothetical protein
LITKPSLTFFLIGWIKKREVALDSFEHIYLTVSIEAANPSKKNPGLVGKKTDSKTRHKKGILR